MLADDMVTLLEAAALGTGGEDLLIGAMPPTPDVMTVITEAGGLQPTHAFSDALPIIEYPRVQVRTRAAPDDYQASRERIEEIYQFFVQRGAETVSGGARYLRWVPIQMPFALGQDDNRRWVFAVNFEVWKEVSSL